MFDINGKSFAFVNLIYFVVVIFKVNNVRAVDQATAPATNTAVLHFEPQVAVMCDVGPQGTETYHPQFMSEQGHWQTDLATKPICPKEKVQILEFCKKAYPKRDITNIVESTHYLKVTAWCRAGASLSGQARGKCKTQRYIKPYRCLEGPFQSDALLVPEGCSFDHVHNATKCWPFGRWNGTAGAACAERGLQLRSFAMLLPCGISLFSGVEFVCCPKHFKESMKPKKLTDVATSLRSVLPSTTDDTLDTDLDDDDDDDDDDDLDDDLSNDRDFTDETRNYGAKTDDDDDDDDDYYDENDTDYVTPSDRPTAAKSDRPSRFTVRGSTTKVTPSTRLTTTSTTTTTTTTVAPTPDPYFTHFDPRIEHESYKQAQERLEEQHREKVTKVMKDWSDLEERYQDMRNLDKEAANAFKARMTRRFQQTVQALEEEAEAEKHQLAAMHQQRVLAHINQRKKEAMQCYTHALNEPIPNTHRVQKCLQKLLRALHKDRAHAIAHYRHLLASSLEIAARDQPRTLERLTDIDRTVNQSLQMLQRFPQLSVRINQLMDDYVQALRSKDDTPGSMLAMSPEAEAEILDKYRMDVINKQTERKQQRAQEQQRKEQRQKELSAIKDEKDKESQVNSDESAADDSEYETDEVLASTTATQQQPQTPEVDTQSSNMHGVDDAAVQRAVEEVAAVDHQEVVRVAHAMRHEISHGEPTFTLHHETMPGARGNAKNFYVTLAFAGVSLMAIAATILAVAAKRRAARHPHAHGFVEVDQSATPEERHVANMQINGYENPTYKYFEVKE